jgi:hypothetical protein
MRLDTRFSPAFGFKIAGKTSPMNFYCRLLTALVVLAAFAARPAEARMYQWVNTQTGRTQMSGKPPSWYRSDQPGPRIFVFDNGRLVDDTSRTVSFEERANLRATAFAISASEEAAALRAAEAKGKAALAANAKPGEESSRNALERGFEDKNATSTKAAETPDTTIARLKSIISAWEDQQTTEAKRVLEKSALVPPAAGKTPEPDASPSAPNTPSP